MEYVVVGACVALFAWAAYRVLYLHLRGLRTSGTIIDIVDDKTSDGPVFNLVVRFTTNTGITIKAKSFYGSKETASYYRIGEQVSILYSVKNPRVFIIEGYDVAGLFFLFLFAAAVCAVVYWNVGNIGS
jgi:hypothetical protein